MKTLVSASAQQLEVTSFVPQLSSGQQEALKWLAIITMTLDHVNKLIFHNDYPALLWLGRLAFPLFAFLIAYNLTMREVKPTRYLYPLFLFAIFTQPVFMWASNEITGNILFTLYLGILYVGLYPLLQNHLPKMVTHFLLIIILSIPSLQVQYGPVGVFLIPVLVAFLKKPTPPAYMGLCLYLVAVNIVSGSSILAFFVSPLHGLYTILSGIEPYAFVPLLLFAIVIFFSRLPLMLRRANPWFFYVFYPAHLLVLHLIAIRLG